MNPLRKTKIVCTLGPACDDSEVLTRMLQAGMNVARVNFAHGSHDEHGARLERLRRASETTGIPVAVLADIKGPEIRTGEVPDRGTVLIPTGGRITVTTLPEPVTATRLSLSHRNLHREVSPGVRILVADGLVDLEVEGVTGTDILCRVRHGGEIGSRKNVNVLGVRTTLPAITEKDVKDIMWSIGQRVDFIAASFIRRPENVREIRGLVAVADAKIDIIAKIEDREGLENIDEIIRVSDGVMVARGDLGVHVSPPEIPLVQKRIISRCNAANKPVITATQMLESMIKNPLPTRAEATDVANAVFDGTDALMLSGETAVGLFPDRTVEMMHRIALETEQSAEYRARMRDSYAFTERRNVSDAVAGAAFVTAADIGARALLTPSLHGHTPKIVSRFRPEQTIIAVTPHETVRRRLLMYWGVVTVISEITHESDSMIENAIRAADRAGLIRPFDKVVILAGIPVDSPIMLNTVRVHLHCKVLAKSRRGYGGRAAGRIVKAADRAEAERRVTGSGDEILLTRYLDPTFYPVLEKVRGYILEEFSAMSYREIAARNPSIVALAGTLDAYTALADGAEVTIDGGENLVYEGRADDMQ